MGGAERNLVQLVEGLQAQDLDQHVVCVSGRGVWADRLEENQIPLTILNVHSAIAVPRGLLRLHRLVSRLQPRIIQGWMYHGNLFATVVHYTAMGRGVRQLFWNLRASNMDAGGYRYHRLLTLSAWLSRCPDLVIANSGRGLDFHLGYGFRPRRMEVIANGIDTHRFRPDGGARSDVRRELGIADDAVVAIHVGRLDPMKDHATFLTALKDLPQIHGLLVGAGTETLSLPTNAIALGIRKDVARLYAAADLIVSTSAFAEGFSNVLAEGMSAGLVPVATETGDVRHIVGDVGHIIPCRNPLALVEVLRRESSQARSVLHKRGLQARERIVAKFNLALANEHYAQLYGKTPDARR
jgi:glycosyltransferase involved in cell wall biosynthesis